MPRGVSGRRLLGRCRKRAPLLGRAAKEALREKEVGETTTIGEDLINNNENQDGGAGLTFLIS